MSECLRNFIEYYKNVGLWSRVRKYRPSERILAKPKAEQESSTNKETRKNIILSWFQYAYQFVNLKLKPGFNEEKKKQTSHQSGENSFFEEEKDEIIDFIPEKIELRKTQSFVQSPSLFEPKAKKIPGVSKNELKDIVKEYNNNITPKDIEKLKTSANPVKFCFYGVKLLIILG